jgi:hypothetical protein
VNTFIAFLAAIGIGTLVAAGISHLTTISGFRQAWINALRDDLAEFLKALQKLDYVITDWMQDSKKHDAERREATLAVLFVFQRVRLRLNRTEDMHIQLERRLRSFLDQPLGQTLSDGRSVDETVDLARRVLKSEWDVTKYPWRGYFRIGQGFPDDSGQFPLGM